MHDSKEKIRIMENANLHKETINIKIFIEKTKNMKNYRSTFPFRIWLENEMHFIVFEIVPQCSSATLLVLVLLGRLNAKTFSTENIIKLNFHQQFILENQIPQLKLMNGWTLVFF